MLRRPFVGWSVAAVVIVVGVWVESMTSYAWEWADLLAGSVVAAAGAWIWRAGHRTASIALTIAAVGWFAGTASGAYHLGRPWIERLAGLHRPLLLVAIVVVSLIGGRSRRWLRLATAATALAVVVWVIRPPEAIAVGSAGLLAIIGALCWLAVRPAGQIRWIAPWLPPLAWALVVDASTHPQWRLPTYASVFASSAVLAAVAVIPPTPHPERSLAIDLGIVDARRRRTDVRLSIADPDDVVVAGPTTSCVVLDDGLRLVVVHPAGVTLTPSMQAELRRTGVLMAAHRQLTMDLLDQTSTVAASRARLAMATDRERQRFELDVRSTVLPQLDRLLEQLPPDADTMRRLVAETRRDVGALCAGAAPSALAGGLLAAVQALAVSSPVPVHVSLEAMPLDPAVERAAWFVIAEAVANAVRHAAAGRIDIAVTRRNAHLVVRVVDDGCGGCDESEGSGLAGLRRRAEALGGALAIRSSANVGTCVELVVADAEWVGALSEPPPSSSAIGPGR